MKIKTSKLTGAALDWAVAKCEGLEITISLSEKYSAAVFSEKYEDFFDPSGSWFQGGPILSREHISRTIDHSGLWIAYWTDGYSIDDDGKLWMHCDRSELVAGLRSYVAAKLGDEVEIPEELT